MCRSIWVKPQTAPNWPFVRNPVCVKLQSISFFHFLVSTNCRFGSPLIFWTDQKELQFQLMAGLFLSTVFVMAIIYTLLFLTKTFAHQDSKVQRQNETCINNCTNTLKNSLGSIIAGGAGYKATRTDMLAPLHSIIRSSANNVVVRRKSEWICLLVDKFKICSDDCDDNKQKMAELANVSHWNTICPLLFSSAKAFADFISCQRRHLEEVGRRCQPFPRERKQQQNLRQFCKEMRDYTECYSETPLKCSRNATKLYQQITASIAQSFTRIQQISRGHLNIPDDCNFPIGEIPKAIVIENADKDVTEDSKFTDYWREEEDINEETEKSRGVARHFGLDSLKMIMPIIFLHIQYI